MSTPMLPIISHLPAIQKRLGDAPTLIVEAAPGAGKTTRIPIALLEVPILSGKKIVMLEPRRLAAVSCAGHMARLLGEKTGQTVGYRIRLDKKESAKTRILVVTEGVFTRMIQSDPELDGIGLVIFDEFHERSIHSDLGLALALESQEAFRPDLRILLMSATMDTQKLSSMLNQAPVIRSKGKVFPVQTFYEKAQPHPNQDLRIEKKCAAILCEALERTRGDILVFLPGVAEIRRLEKILDEEQLPYLVIFPLYGNLASKAQQAVFRPTPKNKRKIIIATAIAETSITIDGVRVVIDAGLMRQPFFSPQTGMTRLETLRVSKACADQRRGRAGRTAPGTCYRLWSEYENSLLQPFSKPEILNTDLSNLVLELAAWGIIDPDELTWMDPPANAAVDQARDLLILLGALDDDGRITEHGRQMVRFGLHPRLSHMVIKAKQMGYGFAACRLAALLMEQDIFLFTPGEYEPDMGFRMDIIAAFENKKPVKGYSPKVKKGVIQRVLASEKKIARDAGVKKDASDSFLAGKILSLAYPDRIAKKRDQQRQTYLTASGKGVYFASDTQLLKNDYIVAVHLDGNPTNAKIFTAAAMDRETIFHLFESRIKQSIVLEWDPKKEEARQKKVTGLSRLTLEETITPITQTEQAQKLFMAEIKKSGIRTLPWNKKLLELKDRVCFLNRTKKYPALPDLSDKALLNSLENWLGPFLTNVWSFAQLNRIDLQGALSALLTWEIQKQVDRLAPSHLAVPSGSKLRLIYRDQTGILDSPVLKVRLQEIFGLFKTPKIADQAIPVTLHLLSPAGRAVQITKDLENFWKNTYHEVKKDLMGRYPKHYWPEDPYTAQAIRGVKPKKNGIHEG